MLDALAGPDHEAFVKAFLMAAAAETWATIKEAESVVGRRARPRDFEATTWLFALLGRQYRADEFAAAIKTLQRTGLIMAHFHTRYDVLLTPTLSKPPIPMNSVKAKGLEGRGAEALGAAFVGARGQVDGRARTNRGPGLRVHSLHTSLQHDGPTGDVGAARMERGRPAHRHAFRRPLRRRSDALPSRGATRRGPPLGRQDTACPRPNGALEHRCFVKPPLAARRHGRRTGSRNGPARRRHHSCKRNRRDLGPG